MTPMRCVECDANVWYRWNGRAYEPWLHKVGETVMITGEPGRRLTLFADPRPDADGRPMSCSAPRRRCCRSAAATGSAGIASVDAPSSPRGWVPQQLVVEEVTAPAEPAALSCESRACAAGTRPRPHGPMDHGACSGPFWLPHCCMRWRRHASPIHVPARFPAIPI